MRLDHLFGMWPIARSVCGVLEISITEVIMCFCNLLSEESGSIPLDLGLSNGNLLCELTLQFWKTEMCNVRDTVFKSELNRLFLFRSFT